jgi:hypothetical protein
MGPSVTYSIYGNLKKGAVVDVIEDASAYYYKVRLDNGLEGYIYKPSGEFTSLPLTKITDKELQALASYPGVTPSPLMGSMESVEVPVATNSTTRTSTRRAAISSANGRPPARTTTSEASGARLSPTAMNVEVTSAEIAVFDTPGIIGRQVAKLRRGEKVGLVSQDGFFYQVKLANGVVGYIPRYAAEAR